MSKEIDINKKVNEIIKEECLAVGFTDRKPFEMLAKLAKAQKMTLDKFGEEHYEEDSATQFKVAELILRMKKLVDNKTEEVRTQTLLIQVSPEDVNRLESITAELKDLQEKLQSDNSQKGKIIEVVDAVIT